MPSRGVALSETSKERFRPKFLADSIPHKRARTLSCLAVGGRTFQDNSTVIKYKTQQAQAHAQYVKRNSVLASYIKVYIKVNESA